MKTVVLRITLAVLLVAASIGYFFARKTHGQQLGVGQPLCISEVPSSWGEFKGGSEQIGFAFQDSAGTVRFVTSVPCGATPQIALEIHRTK